MNINTGVPKFRNPPPPPPRKLVKIDVKAGNMSFGQRIELGKIMASEADEVGKFEKVFLCLHNFTPKEKDYLSLVDYFKEIVVGLKFWIETEATMLVYEPTPEEKRAGVKELMQNIGEFGTIKALAKAYSIDPDEVLKWKYAKVFGILYTDLEESKFQTRYNKVIEDKFKRS